MKKYSFAFMDVKICQDSEEPDRNNVEIELFPQRFLQKVKEKIIKGLKR